jgi:hypothetical protein
MKLKQAAASLLASNTSFNFIAIVLTVNHSLSRLASKVYEEPIMPRIVKRQNHRSNTTDNSPFLYYKLNVPLAILVLGHLLLKLDELFSPEARNCIFILKLVPSVMNSLGTVDIAERVSLFNHTLPYP